MACSYFLKYNFYPVIKMYDLFLTLQVYLKALLLRMRRTLDDDVFMPLYPKK